MFGGEGPRLLGLDLDEEIGRLVELLLGHLGRVVGASDLVPDQIVAERVIGHDDLALVLRLHDVHPLLGRFGDELGVVDHRPGAPDEGGGVGLAIEGVPLRLLEEGDVIGGVRQPRVVDLLQQAGLEEVLHVAVVGGDDVERAEPAGAQGGEDLVVAAEVDGVDLDAGLLTNGLLAFGPS